MMWPPPGPCSGATRILSLCNGYVRALCACSGDELIEQEVDALERLSTAIVDLIKSQAMQYIKGQIIRQTVLASLLAALSPMAWLKLTKLIGKVSHKELLSDSECQNQIIRG